MVEYFLVIMMGVKGGVAVVPKPYPDLTSCMAAEVELHKQDEAQGRWGALYTFCVPYPVGN